MKLAKPVELTRNDAKAFSERAMFAAFAKAGRQDIILSTIESCDPPRPDISCQTEEGERLSFELAELCAPEIAKGVGDVLRAGGGVSFTWASDPSRDILMKKLGKQYDAPGAIDLLFYVNGFVASPDFLALAEMRATIDEFGFGPFRSIWFHGTETAYLVAETFPADGTPV